MASEKKSKSVVDKAMGLKPVAAAKGMIAKAADAATDAFMNPPMAPDLPKTRKVVRRASPKTAAKKSSGKRAAGKSMDRKLVSSMEDYEIKYLAQKHQVTQKAVREAVSKVGPSRNKVERELKAGKR